MSKRTGDEIYKELLAEVKRLRDEGMKSKREFLERVIEYFGNMTVEEFRTVAPLIEGKTAEDELLREELLEATKRVLH